MASPSELSLEEIRKYLLDNGGSARNQELVKHFKKFLTDPETRVEARNRFKEYINTLATIKTEEGEKYLILRKKFRQPTLDLSSPTLSFSGFPSSPISTPDLGTPTSPLREPPPYRPPPTAPLSPIRNTSSPIRRYPQDPPIGLPVGLPTVEPIAEPNVSINASRLSETEGQTSSPVTSPPVPPRRKSQDKIKLANKENQSVEKGRNGSESIKEDETVPSPASSNQLTPAEQLSVRERMQRFNRMANETDLPAARPNASTPPIKKRSDKGTEEDDRASVASQLDGKSREWLVRAAQGDYQALAKLAAEEPRLTRIKYNNTALKDSGNSLVRRKRQGKAIDVDNILPSTVIFAHLFQIAINSLNGNNILQRIRKKVQEALGVASTGEKQIESPIIGIAPVSCTINIKYLQENHALILKEVDETRYEFRRPDNESGNITVLPGGTLFLSCGHYNNFFEKIRGVSYSEIICREGSLFYVVNDDKKTHDFYTLKCDSTPPPLSTNEDSNYGNNVKLRKHYFVPIPGLDAKVEFMDVYIDESTTRPLYTKTRIPSIIAGGQTAAHEREISEVDYSLKSAYTKQKDSNGEFRSQLLCINANDHKCPYFREKDNNEFVPGLLTHPSYFLYKVAGIPTYNYMNTGPQWPRINKGNWAHIQDYIYELVKARGIDLDVYTGTFGNLELVDNADEFTEKEISLNPNGAANSDKPLPIPHYYWIIAHEPQSGLGVVFVTVNNPFIICGSDHYICQNPQLRSDNVLMPRHWEPSNFEKGYSYMCDVNDFLSTTKLSIKGVSETVGLLHLEGDLWEQDFDHTYILTMVEQEMPDYEDEANACKFNVEDLSEHTPQILNSWSYKDFSNFYYPDERGIIKIKSEDDAVFLCSGPNNQFSRSFADSQYISPNGIHRFKCKEGKLEFHGNKYNFNDLRCKENPSFEVSAYNGVSLPSPLKIYWIRFFALDQKINFIKLYYNETALSTSYVEYRMRNTVAARQKCIEDLERDIDDVDSHLGANIADFYKLSKQKDRFGPGSKYKCPTVDVIKACRRYEETSDSEFALNIVGAIRCINGIWNQYQDCNFFDFDRSKYFVPALLAPPIHFPFLSMANATFTYMNTRPMWKSIADVNWARVNRFVYDLVKTLDEEEVVVYSGTSGVLQLANTYYFEDINLSSNGYTLPVPKHFWKFVYSKTQNKGIFIIVLNNPWENETKGLRHRFYERICTPQSVSASNLFSYDKIDGYTYFCDPSEILRDIYQEIKLYKEDGTRWLDPLMKYLPIPESAVEKYHPPKDEFA